MQQLALFLASRLCKSCARISNAYRRLDSGNCKHLITFLSQNTLQMPSEIQTRIAHTIDNAIEKRLAPATLAVHEDVHDLSVAQKTSSVLVEQAMKEVGQNLLSGIQRQTDVITLDLQRKFDALSLSQTESMETGLRKGPKTDRIIANAFERQICASEAQNSSMHQKLDRMNWLMGTVKDRVADLSGAEQSAALRTGSPEIGNAIADIHKGVWSLVSALHFLIRELM